MAELFWAGQPADLARWPNLLQPSGNWQWAKTAGGYPANCAGNSPTPGSRPPCTGFTAAHPFTNSSAQLAAWALEAAERDPALVGYWTWDWHEVYLPLVGVNVTAMALITADPAQPGRNFPMSGTYYSALTNVDRQDLSGCATHDWVHCKPGVRWLARNLLVVRGKHSCRDVCMCMCMPVCVCDHLITIGVRRSSTPITSTTSSAPARPPPAKPEGCFMSSRQSGPLAYHCCVAGRSLPAAAGRRQGSRAVRSAWGSCRPASDEQGAPRPTSPCTAMAGRRRTGQWCRAARWVPGWRSYGSRGCG